MDAYTSLDSPLHECVYFTGLTYLTWMRVPLSVGLLLATSSRVVNVVFKDAELSNNYTWQQWTGGRQSILSDKFL